MLPALKALLVTVAGRGRRRRPAAGQVLHQRVEVLEAVRRRGGAVGASGGPPCVARLGVKQSGGLLRN